MQGKGMDEAWPLWNQHLAPSAHRATRLDPTEAHGSAGDQPLPLRQYWGVERQT